MFARGAWVVGEEQQPFVELSKAPERLRCSRECLVADVDDTVEVDQERVELRC
jgi:hypothetical protein